MKITKSLTPLFLLVLLLLSSCTSTVAYNPSYEGRLVSLPSSPLLGQALILTTEADDIYTFNGNPTSFTGGATKLSIPLGLISREISQNVFERVFTEGAIHANRAVNASNYRVVITPKVSDFTYAYNQLKNAGFLVTPQVEMTVSVTVLDERGASMLVKNYRSDTRDGDSYALSANPADRINKLAHETLTDLMNQAALDVYYLLSNVKS